MKITHQGLLKRVAQDLNEPQKVKDLTPRLHGAGGLGLPEVPGLGPGLRRSAAHAARCHGGVCLWRLRAPGAGAAGGEEDLEARGRELEAHVAWKGHGHVCSRISHRSVFLFRLLSLV